MLKCRKVCASIGIGVAWDDIIFSFIITTIDSPHKAWKPSICRVCERVCIEVLVSQFGGFDITKELQDSSKSVGFNYIWFLSKLESRTLSFSFCLKDKRWLSVFSLKALTIAFTCCKQVFLVQTNTYCTTNMAL